MVQPNTPPLSIRPGANRLAEIDAWATDHGLTRHAAVLALIDFGLGKGGEPVMAAPAPTPKPVPPAKAAPSLARSKTVVAPARRPRGFDVSGKPIY